VADWKQLAEDIFNDEKYNAQYLVCGLETSEAGVEHGQAYVYYDKRVTLGPRYLRHMHDTYVPGIHFEKANGSPKQNELYCKKGKRM